MLPSCKAFRWGRCLLAAGLALAAWAGPGVAVADTHALILTIGQYAQPSARLRGSAADAQLARQIVERMGATQVVVLADGALDFSGLRQAIRSMRDRVRPGDTLLVYFSGHGRRLARAGELGQCQVGLVSVEGRYYLDRVFESDLQALAAQAARVVVFNDSCHAAGAVATSKHFRGLTDDWELKAYPADDDALDAQAKGADPAAALAGNLAARRVAPDDDDACARISNAPSKAFRGMATEDKLSVLAAAAPNEAAWSSPRGSLATMAWHQCLVAPRLQVDRNGDGQISPAELAACANALIPALGRGKRQTVIAQFNQDAPLARAAGR